MTTTTLTPTVYGVGINDVPGSSQTLYCRKWYNMLIRCYDPNYHASHPTYVDCNVDPQWHHLSDFKYWYEDHDRNVDDFHLDKDIIYPHNKTYSPDTCLLVPRELNNFFLKRDGLRGNYLIGASFNKWHKKFESRVSDNVSKRKLHLGFFKTEQEAHKTWLNKKRELFYQYFIVDMDIDYLKPHMIRVYNNFEEYFV